MSRLHKRTLHHALLLSGPAGLGKQDFAYALAESILCKTPGKTGACGLCQSCHLFAAGNHPDFHLLTSEKQLGVDKIREGIGKLASTAQLGNNKVVVMPQAETMTEAAANALLKTLEEPTRNTYLLLLTSRLNGLLPTILSRCEKHMLSLPGKSELQSWLAGEGFPHVTERYLGAYGYSPLTIKASLAEKGEKLTYDEFEQALADLKNGDVRCSALAGKWQDDAAQVVTWLQAEAHQAFLKSSASADYQRAMRCMEAKQRLAHAGVNKSVILTGILTVFSSQ
ncbi:DNA polymerase III subunit delta' [Aestuariibacter sp. A3R04]|nr:DNA polymerase III subunit delta' [Aestuariibacter sp. A3R04]MBU3022726.1 DNA polymerase III subunit delta' [Aestuariibacter sp. A3R04]